MKTKGMAHQLQALRRMCDREAFALFMEQGTGKTWTILADAERQYAANNIDALLVIAPKGVHTNWIRREIPTHMAAPIIARAWHSGMGKRERAKVEELLAPRDVGKVVPLRILAMSFDAVCTKDGFDFATKFLRCTKAMLALDESSRIKNPDAKRTKEIMRLRPLAKLARIASGTPITNSPLDIFSQMEFLESGLLGTTSYRAFVAEYAELMDKNHPMVRSLIQRNPKVAHAQMVARNPDGSKRWRNLDKLQRLIEPHSFRVLKRDCLDLPEKVYKQVYFELEPAQRRAYDLMKEEARIALGDGTVEPVQALAALVKLQQITSGFVMRPDQKGTMYVSAHNPRLAALLEAVEDIDGKFIVWAKFHEELDAVAAALRKTGRNVVEYHGRVAGEDRERAVDSFQNGMADVFVGHAASGGLGLTLTAAEHAIYYSNDFNLEHRLQSEDRNHRIGTKRSVLYIDIVAEDTIDEPIARALQTKAALAATILGDAPTTSTMTSEAAAAVRMLLEK
jgi:SNF2 family DNA or RNA helicase